LTIQVPSHFFYEWLEQHYITLLRKVIKKELGQEGTLEYSIVMENNTQSRNPYTVKLPTSNASSLKNAPVNMPINVNEKQIRNPFVIPGLKKVNIESNLIPNFTFENFVEGECNRLARASGFAVANKPGGTAFNLYYYMAVLVSEKHTLPTPSELPSRKISRTKLYFTFNPRSLRISLSMPSKIKRPTTSFISIK
jgi:chromosomal replication initiator protein